MCLAKYQPWLYAFSLHLFVLAACMVLWNKSNPHQGRTVNEFSTYLYSPAQGSQRTRQAQEKMKSVSVSTSTAASSEKSVQHKSVAQVDNQFLAMLHQRIAEQQIYPESAMVLKQTGTVMVGFYLGSDGRLDDISIQQTSGVASLDAAALSAVKSVGVIENAAVYAPKRNFFTVAVKFVL